MTVLPVLFAVFAAAMADGTGKATASGCDKPSSYDATLNFTQEVGSDGRYPNGTLVMASCKGGNCIRDGGSHALCLDGQWVPKLGRCPYHCRLSEFPEKRGYLYAEPDPYEENPNDYRPHGSLARPKCQVGMSLSGPEVVGHPYKCHDGGWQSLSSHTRCV